MVLVVFELPKGDDGFRFINSDHLVFEGIEQSCYITINTQSIKFWRDSYRQFPNWTRVVPAQTEMQEILKDTQKGPESIFNFSDLYGMNLPLFIRASKALVDIRHFELLKGYFWRGYENKEDPSKAILLSECDTEEGHLYAVVMPYSLNS
jgi:hypothetical protein